MKSYPHVARIVGETPWAILPEKLAEIQVLLAFRLSGGTFSTEEMQARLGPRPEQRQTSNPPSVAVIPIYGTLIPRASLMSDLSGPGGASVTDLSNSLRAAVNDPAISSILLDIDSPGGMTDQIPEFAALIREAREVKPVHAIANATAASAAYWIGSQADHFTVTPSGLVGSIGVFAAHEDISAKQEMEGITTTMIRAGKHKADTHPFAPLSDEARAAIQERVSEFYDFFASDVAIGRNVSVDQVKNGFGEGRVVTASQALKMGMVDRVATFEETIEAMLEPVAGNAGMSVNGRWAVASSATGSAGMSTNGRWAANGANPSFAQQAEHVANLAQILTNDARSLADVRLRSRLTAAKRSQLLAVHNSLEESVSALAGLLADTDPNPLTAEDRSFIEQIAQEMTA